MTYIPRIPVPSKLHATMTAILCYYSLMIAILLWLWELPSLVFLQAVHIQWQSAGFPPLDELHGLWVQVSGFRWWWGALAVSTSAHPRWGCHTIACVVISTICDSWGCCVDWGIGRCWFGGWPQVCTTSRLDLIQPPENLQGSTWWATVHENKNSRWAGNITPCKDDLRSLSVKCSSYWQFEVPAHAIQVTRIQ